MRYFSVQLKSLNGHITVERWFTDAGYDVRRWLTQVICDSVAKSGCFRAVLLVLSAWEEKDVKLHGPSVGAKYEA